MELTTLFDAIMLANNMQYVHWMAAGNKFDRLHLLCEEYYNKAREDYDILAEIFIELGHSVLNPAKAIEYSSIKLESKNNYSWEDGIFAIYKNIEKYVESLLEFRSNEKLSNDIKSELDTIIRYWKKENYYKNVRRMKET